MRRRTVIALAGTLVMVVTAWVFRPKLSTRSEHTENAEHAATDSTVLASPSSGTESPNSQIDPGSLNREELRVEVRRRDARDSKWEWKIPIKFYGKVVDETGQPIPGADVHFQWTDLSAKGTTDRQARSDAQGLFSLDNVSGKRLIARVNKPGYYASDSRNHFSFEYANPFEEIFQRANIHAPVLFYLRKQNPTADVISKSVEMVLPGDGTGTTVELLSGKISATGQLQVQAWKPWPPRPMSPAYKWKVMFVIPAGGFIETHEDFAFKAPEAGYQETYEIDMNPTLSSQWQVSAERSMYFTFGEPRKYGRLSLRTDGNSRYIFLDYVFNQSGSRNLEPASKTR
ncbi:MAG: hypothetical protein DME97_12205 [Verrucomicrobia bacterium]|nr:MAG: hypothetical protein DME97_12205 [Verrucomicrobiota bacterium]